MKSGLKDTDYDGEYGFNHRNNLYRDEKRTERYIKDKEDKIRPCNNLYRDEKRTESA